MNRYEIEYRPDQNDLIEKIAEQFGIVLSAERDIARTDLERELCNLYNKEGSKQFLFGNRRIEEERIQKFKDALKSNNLKSVVVWIV